ARQAQELLAAMREAQVALQAAQQRQVDEGRAALAAAAEAFRGQAEALADTLGQSQARLEAALAAREGERLAAWTRSLAALGTALREEWRQLGQAAAQEQRQAYAAIAESAQAAAEQARAHGAQTIAEVGRLVEAATRAPRAAAEVVESLRQSLSESMVRDTAM